MTLEVREKFIHQPICLYDEEEKIIQEEFSKYGDLTGFVRFCISNKSQLEKYVRPQNKPQVFRQITLSPNDKITLKQNIPKKGDFSKYIRFCLHDKELVAKFKNGK